MAVRVAVVPAEILEPPDAGSRGHWQAEAASVLDDWLRRLAATEARRRLAFGRLAASFVRRRGVARLGFARLDDYARERLGCSGREVQSIACVAERLATFPALTTAFRSGELSWTQVRLLSCVATTDTERAWVERAHGLTSRALEALIRQDGNAPASTDVVEEEDDDQPTVRVRLRCSRRLRRHWSEAVELARRVAGAHLTTAQAAEAIAAEGLSAASVGGDDDTDWVAAQSPVAPPADPTETLAALAPDVDWSAVRVAVEEVEGLSGTSGDSTDDPTPAVDVFALDDCMRAAARALQHVDWQVGRLLRVFLDRRLHRVLGFASSARYLRERLGISARKARALVAVERKTWTAPALGDAYRSGALSWVRALTLLPVANEATASAWVARAQAVTVRRLADEVEWALVTGAPGPPPAGSVLEVTEERQMRACAGDERHDTEIVFTAPVPVAGLFRTAMRAFAADGDRGPAAGLEGLLDHVRATWSRLPRHRDPVFARDGWRCAVPACSARRMLHDHHLLFRSRGGTNAPTNRVTVCAWHHLQGIHGGLVRAWGRAPHAVTWELGLRSRQRPLMRLVGDVYVL